MRKKRTAQFTAGSSITERQKVGDLMREATGPKKSALWLRHRGIQLTSFEFSEEFNAAIEAKQTAQAERAESRAGPGPHQGGSSAADRTGPCRGRELPAEKSGDHPGNTCHGMDQQMGRQAAQRRFRRLDDVRYFRYHRRSRLRQKRLRSLNTRGSLSAERRFRRSR